MVERGNTFGRECRFERAVRHEDSYPHKCGFDLLHWRLHLAYDPRVQCSHFISHERSYFGACTRGNKDEEDLVRGADDQLVSFSAPDIGRTQSADSLRDFVHVANTYQLI